MASPKYKGWRNNPANSRLDAVYNDSAAASVDANGLTLRTGKVLDASAGSITMAAGEVGAADLSTNLKTGYINLPLAGVREIGANDIENTATNAGGVLAKNTTPILERVNAATDKAMRISWAANDVDEVTFSPIAYPPDLDDTAAVTVKLAVAKNTNTNTTTNLAVSYFEGIGDTNAGTSTAAFAVSTLAVYSVTIAAADVGAAPTFATIGLTPAAHANDAIYLMAAWVEYTRKS